MKITNTNDIQAAIAKFLPSADGAYATSRCLQGQYAQENQQEWACGGTISGQAATVYYIFENTEVDVEDGDDIPFDADHIDRIDRIEIADA